MENVIKVGVGVMIKDGGKILLGHRVARYRDTGGIYEPDSWTLPGGKQEYTETAVEAAIREVKEETNINLHNLKVFGVSDDIQPDRHFVTIQFIAEGYSGEPKVMEPNKLDEWRWFELSSLPKNLYSPSRKFIEDYKKNLQ